jgi:hypothetical protein
MRSGIFKARIESYGIGETKSGQPFLAVNLLIKESESDAPVHAQWSGYIHSEKSLQITEKALKVMGMETPNFELLASGKGLDSNKVFSVTVEDETTDTGKVYQKVKWINELGAGGKSELLDKGSALKLLANLGLASASSKITTETIPF